MGRGGGGGGRGGYGGGHGVVDTAGMVVLAQVTGTTLPTWRAMAADGHILAMADMEVGNFSFFIPRY